MVVPRNLPPRQAHRARCEACITGLVPFASE